MILSRYLIREIFHYLLVISLVFLAALLSQQVVRYLNYAAIGKVPTNVLFQLVIFEIPYLLAFILPLGLYLGILIGMGRLYANNEIVVMKMGGFHYKKIARAVFIAAFFIFVVVLFLMMWVNPRVSLERQRIMESNDVTTHMIETLVPGRFKVSPDGKFVMYVEALSRDHLEAENVFIAEASSTDEFDATSKWRLVLAKTGLETQDVNHENQFFVTTDGYRYEGAPGQNDYKIIQFKQYAIRMPQNTEGLHHPEVETLSFSQLISSHATLLQTAEWQWRISIALSALLFAMLALPLSAEKPRRMSRYIVLLPALICYLIYINLLFAARHWVEVGAVNVVIGMWWVPLLMMMVAGCLMFFLKDWRN